jgi:hypothetical protein
MLRTWLLRLIMGSREDFSVRPAAVSELSAVAELLRTADLPTKASQRVSGTAMRWPDR